jgi:hypothetical protein
MIKLPVTVNIPASSPVAYTLPSLAYKNSGAKQATAALPRRGQYLRAGIEGLWVGQGSGSQRGPPEPLLLLGGCKLSLLHPVPENWPLMKTGKEKGWDQVWKVEVSEHLICGAPPCPLASTQPARTLCYRSHFQKPWANPRNISCVNTRS